MILVQLVSMDVFYSMSQKVHIIFSSLCEAFFNYRVVAFFEASFLKELPKLYIISITKVQC